VSGVAAFLRRVLATLATLAAFALAGPQLGVASAFADETHAAPADVGADTLPDSRAGAPGAFALPALPASYQVQHLGWWTVAYPAAVRERVQPLIEHADAWRAQLTADFGQDVLTRPIEVRIGRSWTEMSNLVPHELGVPTYAAGVTYGRLRVVLLSLTEPAGGDATDLETVFHHELSHVALDDATAGRAQAFPRWFNEGLAIHESGEHPIDRMRVLWDATLFRQLLPLSELDHGFTDQKEQVNLAYAESADVVRFFLRGKDHVRFISLLDRVRDGAPFDRALADAYGTDVRRLEYQWREECAKRNTFAPMLASGSFIWVLAFGALVLGYRRRRRQTQETLARWEREEQREALARMPAAVEDETPFSDPARVLAGLPKVEHDGGWHTLH
jgi:hypothetical protein